MNICMLKYNNNYCIKHKINVSKLFFLLIFLSSRPFFQKGDAKYYIWPSFSVEMKSKSIWNNDLRILGPYATIYRIQGRGGKSLL